MLLHDIPNIQFESHHESVVGVDIRTIESLAALRNNFDHDPEKPHQLDFNLLVVFTRGNARHFIDFEWHEVAENTVLHLSKGQINAFEFTPSIAGFIIPFTDDYLSYQLSILPKVKLIQLFNSQVFSAKIDINGIPEITDYTRLLYKEFYQEKITVNKQSVCNSLFAIIFSKLEALKQVVLDHLDSSRHLEEFLEFRSLLATQYTESRNADFYADQMHISYKHLNNICKNMVDLTAKQVIDQFVVLEAKRKLINSTVKSTQLAYLLGFEEATNFIKYFKKHTGFTPNKFKNKYQ